MNLLYVSSLVILLLGAAGQGLFLTGALQFLADRLGSQPGITCLLLSGLLSGFAVTVWLCSRSTRRPARPLGQTGAAQVALGLYSILLSLLLPFCDKVLLAFQKACGYETFGALLLTWCASAFFLLPVTSVMGFSFVRSFLSFQQQGKASRGAGWSLLTLCGGLAVAFLTSGWGLAQGWQLSSLAILGLLLLATGFLALLLSQLAEPPYRQETPPGSISAGWDRRRVLSCMGFGAVTGLLMFLMARLVSGSLRPGQIGVCSLAAAALLSFCAGTALRLRLIGRNDRPETSLGHGFIICALFYALSAYFIRAAPALSLSPVSVKDVAWASKSSFAGDFFLASAFLFLPFLAMGQIVPLLMETAAEQEKGQGMAVSLVLAGAGLSLLVYTPFAWFAGLRAGIAVAAFTLAALGAWLVRTRLALVPGPLVLILFTLFNPGKLRPDHPGRFTVYREGPDEIVAVTASGTLQANGREMRSAAADGKANLPMLLSLSLMERPSSVLLKGWTAGDAKSAVHLFPTLRRIDVLVSSREAEAAVLQAGREGQKGLARKGSASVRVWHGPPVPFLRTSVRKWSVIVSGPDWWPGRRETNSRAFRKAPQLFRDHLVPGGIFCSAVSVDLRPDRFERALAAFATAFGTGQVWFFAPGQVILTASTNAPAAPLSHFEELFTNKAFSAALEARHVGNLETLLGSCVCTLSHLHGKSTDPRKLDLAGSDIAQWSRKNLNFLHELFERRQPLSIRSRDTGLPGRLQAARAGLKHLLKALAEKSTGNEREFRREIEAGLGASPEDSRLRAQLAKKPFSGTGGGRDRTERESAGANAAGASREEESEWKTHMQQGELAFKFGKYPLALMEFRKAAAAAPGREEPVFNLAIALSRLGRHEEAIEQYQQILEYNPKHLDARINLGFTFAMLGRISEAKKAYLAALSQDPKSALAHYNLATIYRREGKEEEAMDEYDAAIRIKPKYAEAIYDYAAVLYEREEYLPAQSLLERFLDLRPASPRATEARKILRELRRKIPKR